MIGEMMIRTLKSLLIAGCIASSTIAFGQDPPRAQDATKFLEKAIRVVSEIHSGEARADLERDFVLDGGLQTAQNSRYVYRTCHLVKIDVEFTISNASALPEPAPTDQVKHISKPYLEYPYAD
jgi:hypothetical protein